MYKYTKTLDFNENTSHGMLASRVRKGDRILEFGCSRGEFAAYVTENFGCSVVGVEISAEALDMARDSLEKSILADIERDDWESELAGEKFDVIMYADVLEHLREPEKAIERALKYLKEDGRVIFSVPNIAHSDIILKLLQNRFDYTDIGLLDNTHIHFFGMANIPEFCSRSGLFLEELAATYVPEGCTEQKGGEDNSARRLIRNNAGHEIYQFVCVAYKSEYAKAEGLKYVNNIRPDKNFSAVVYFDRGEGFSDADKNIIYDKTYGKIDFTLENLDGVRALRVDLREYAGYTVKNAEFIADGRAILPTHTVGVCEYDGESVLYNDDSQYIFTLPAGIETFAVKADIEPLFDGANMTLFGESARKKAEELSSTKNTLKNTESTLAETKSNLDGALTTLHHTNLKLNSTTAKLNETNAQLAHYKEHYEVAMAQREDLKRRLAKSEEEFAIISNAGFWKITKPLRVTFDFVKKSAPVRLFRKFVQSVRTYGLKYTFKKIARKLHNKKAVSNSAYTPEDIKKQRKKIFERNIKFSILVPLYNTPEKYLKEMIDSVKAQTYSNWELCLADGSDAKHTYVEKICEKYVKGDSRIKYNKLEKNLGISGNTNACIDMATGEYIALFDHDDMLHECALYEVMSVICKEDADFIYTDETTFHSTPADAFCPNFKPDYSPDTLRSYNYICHLSVFKASLLEKTGKFRPAFDGSQDYDMILRLTEAAEKIVHIPIILYYWRAHKNSVASDISAKPYTLDAARRALSEHIERLGLSGKVEDSRIPSTYKITYDIVGEPLVSIIIPNKDHTDDLDKCIKSICEKSTYRNFEIIVVENNSTEEETFEYYENAVKEYESVKVVRWEYEFNYSKINNFGFEYAKGEHIILLNNDIEILTPSWIEEMLMFTQRKDVGAAGMMLYYSDDTVQHAGVIMGIGGVAGHSHKYYKRGDFGYMSRLSIAQNLSAVTAAAMMIRSDVFREIKGLDESFAVAFNDVDMCMRIRRAGYLIVWTPYAEAYHYESKSRGYEDTPEKQRRFKGEIDNFFSKWQDFLDGGDPYYNPNLTLEREDFSAK